MEYRDDVEKSAEYLRLALAHMGRHKAGLHPVSYAVWYEYVAGINPALHRCIDALIRDGAVLDDGAVHRLFRDHIAEIDASLARRVSENFGRVMDAVSASTSQVADEASQFGLALERWSDDLATGRHVTTPSHSVGELLNYSRTMHQTVRALHDRLEESHREVETLRKEVERAREEAMIDELTGLTNRRGFERVFADYLNGSGQVEIFQPVYGFGEPLVGRGLGLLSPPALGQRFYVAGQHRSEAGGLGRRGGDIPGTSGA